MRLTNLFVLSVCASLIVMSDLASAQKALTGPTASESELVTSQGRTANGVPEARGSVSEGLANLFESPELKRFENNLASVYSLHDPILYADFRAKIAEMNPKLHDSFVQLTRKPNPSQLVELNYHARKLFKSDEFRALYEKIRSMKSVDENGVMYDFLARKFGVAETAQLLWLGAEHGSGYPKDWARLVEEAQHRKWMISGKITRPMHVAAYLKVPKYEHDHVRDRETVLHELASRYWKAIENLDLHPPATSA